MSAHGRRRIRRALAATVATASMALAAPAPAAPAAPTAAPSTPQARAQALVAQMTLSEKVDMLRGNLNNYYGFYNAPIPRLGIPALKMADGPAGIRIANPTINNKLSTQLPAPITLASSWDTALANQYGTILGKEAFASTHNMVLGPAVDMARTARGGRTFESYGEDPLVTGTMAASEIRGIQSTKGVIADIKHFNAYNQETNRLQGGNAIMDERTLQEIYTRPFAQGIKDGDVGSAMCSFNKVNYVYACDSSELMTEILRTQEQFQGWVLSDYGSTMSSTVALKAGMDQEHPNGAHFASLEDAVAKGQLDVAVIDRAVTRILTAMFKYGLMDNPALGDAKYDWKADADLAQSIAEKSIVLMKNQGAALPLSAAKVKSVAVIGSDVDSIVQGGGSSLVNPTDRVTLVDGIKQAVGSRATVSHLPGTDGISSGSLLPGMSPIPSDYLRTPNGKPGIQVTSYQDWEKTKKLATQTWPYVGLNGGFFYYEGLNSQSASIPKFPTTATSAVYDGTLTAPVTGQYQLEVFSSGTAKVTLDGRTIFSTPSTQAFRRTVTVNLVKGHSYKLHIDYTNNVSGGTDTGPQLKLGWQMPKAVVAPQAAQAAALAKKSDVAVVMVRDYGSEGSAVVGGEHPNLNLPNGQEELIKAVAKANPHTIVVLANGHPLVTGAWDKKVPAVLETFYSGQRQGAAIARILFGTVNPSGKLTLSFPRSESAQPVNTPSQYPGNGLDIHYSEGIFMGYRGYDKDGYKPAYAFGHGLSYTSFAYSGLRVSVSGGTTVRASFTVRNTGKVAGSEVAQVYAGTLPTKQVQTARKSLAGFTKVALAPGQSKRVTVTLDKKSLSYWDSYNDTWITPSGNVKVMVGGASDSLPLSATATIRSHDVEGRLGVRTDKAVAMVNGTTFSCLDVKDRNTANGATVQQYACPRPENNQQWKLVARGGGYYSIASMADTGKVLDVAGGASATQDGARVQLWASTGGTNQQFRFVKVGSPDAGFYQVVARNSGKCVSVVGSSGDNGALVEQRSCDASDSGQWFALKRQTAQ